MDKRRHYDLCRLSVNSHIILPQKSYFYLILTVRKARNRDVSNLPKITKPEISKQRFVFQQLGTVLEVTVKTSPKSLVIQLTSNYVLNI